jgi:hypothetical protein
MTDHGFYPDELTVEAITALPREVDREPRHEGYPVRYGERPANRRPVRGPVESVTEPTSTPPLSSTSPLPGGHGRPGGQGAADGVGPSADRAAGDPARVLFTPAQAAGLLQVRESWLRRRAARRLVPCTFLGKHLRFSRANLEQIAADPAATTRPTTPGTGGRPGRPRGRARTSARRPGAGQRTRSSRT